jgi:hypothetical protein
MIRLTRRKAVLALPLFAQAIATPLAAKQEALRAFRETGVSFDTPSDWRVDDTEGDGTLFCYSPPVDGGVEASMLIELPKPGSREAAEGILRRTSSSRRQRYSDYVERELTLVQTKAGIFYYLLACEGTRTRLPTVEHLMHFLLPRERLMFVATSTAKWAEKAYRPVFSSFIDSIRVAK